MSRQGEKARVAITRARSTLLLRQPFYGTLALYLKLVEIEAPSDGGKSWCDTMAVDGVHLYFWPEFVLAQSEPELVGVVAHEVEHCALQHMTRRGHRQPDIWNVAGDYRINWDLVKAGFTLPGKPIPWSVTPNDDKGHLIDKRFAEMSTDTIYEQIRQDLIKANKTITTNYKWMGEVLDAAKPGSKQSADVVSRKWDGITRIAIGVARSRGAGTLPGYLQHILEILEEPELPWQAILAQWLDGNQKKDRSWARPNRRMISKGLIFPGPYSDSVDHLVACFDTSGSVSNEMLKKMLSEVGGALDTGMCDRLTAVYADTKVQHVDTYTAGDVFVPGRSGRGGTAFKNTFEWIKTNAPDASCVIYLTDMETSDWGEDPGIPVLWCAYAPKQVLSRYNPPFGKVIEVNSD